MSRNARVQRSAEEKWRDGPITIWIATGCPPLPRCGESGGAQACSHPASSSPSEGFRMATAAR